MCGFWWAVATPSSERLVLISSDDKYLFLRFAGFCRINLASIALTQLPSLFRSQGATQERGGPGPANRHNKKQHIHPAIHPTRDPSFCVCLSSSCLCTASSIYSAPTRSLSISCNNKLALQYLQIPCLLENLGEYFLDRT